MPPSNRRFVLVDFLYPPDASPPQVLTVKTVGNGTADAVSGSGE